MNREDRFRSLMQQGDLDEVVREVDRLAERGDWEGLVALRRACAAAWDLGHQLWPASAWAAYRLVLEADPAVASPVAVEDVAFTPGPLTEVLASRAHWGDVGPHLPDGPGRAWVAQERVVRGEAVTEAFPAELVEVHLTPADWEPTWPVARYRVEGADADGPPVVALGRVEMGPGGRADDAAGPGVEALDRVTRRWCRLSDARSAVAGVRGDAPEAVAALPGRAGTGVAWAEVPAADGLAHLAWAASTGGRRGRRAGAAVGRVEALWTLAALADLADDWPVHPDDLGRAAAQLRWYRWEPHDAEPGWSLRLAVADPDFDLAWAIETVDPEP